MFSAKKCIFLMLAVCLVGSVAAQQELMLHNLPNLWHANMLNPAMFPHDKKIAIGLGAFSLDQVHSGEVNLSQFVRVSNKKTYLDFGGVLDQLQDNNSIRFDLRTETVSFGMKLGGWKVMAHHAIRQTADGDYPKTLPDILWRGNGPYIGKEVSIAPVGNFQTFNELAVGISRKILAGNFAVRLKFLNGAAAFITDPNHTKATIYTSDDIYQLRLETDYAFHSAVIINALDTAGLGYDINFGKVRILQLFSKNRGTAIDFGFSTRLAADRIQLSVSLLDWNGKIKWKDNANYFKSQGKHEYDGIEIPGADIITGGDNFNLGQQLDTLNDIFQFQKTPTTFTTTLPARFYGGANLEVTEKLTVGLSILHWKNERKKYTAVGAAANFDVVKWLSLGAMYALNGESKSNLGFSIVLKPGPVQAYLVSDNLLNLFRATTSPSLNFRVGGSLVF